MLKLLCYSWLQVLSSTGFLETLLPEESISVCNGSHVSFLILDASSKRAITVTENMTSQNYTLEKGGSSVVLDHEDTYSPVVFKAATKVSILCLPGYRREEDTYLRTGIVFDGPNVNSPFLGRLVFFLMRDFTEDIFKIPVYIPSVNLTPNFCHLALRSLFSQ